MKLNEIQQRDKNIYISPFNNFYAVPSAPPDNVQAGMLNLTAGWVRWSPPPPQHHNGHLLGYKIQVFFDNII